MRWSTGFFLVAAAIVVFRYWLTEPRTRNDGAAMLTGALMFLALVIAAIGGLLRVADARDLDGRYANSPLKQWFDGLRSGKGPCCSDADGFALKDVDWESKAGRYRVFVEGEWHDVPPNAVITEPNRAGRTMVWPIKGPYGIDIICFMPGPMT